MHGAEPPMSYVKLERDGESIAATGVHTGKNTCFYSEDKAGLYFNSKEKQMFKEQATKPKAFALSQFAVGARAADEGDRLTVDAKYKDCTIAYTKSDTSSVITVYELKESFVLDGDSRFSIPKDKTVCLGGSYRVEAKYLQGDRVTFQRPLAVMRSAEGVDQEKRVYRLCDVADSQALSRLPS
eukprot:3089570-Prymnesium_polylepis.1